MIHMFAFRWKPVATEEQKDRAIAEIASFKGRVPGLLEVNIGKNISPRGQGYETGGVMKFKDADALAKYSTHPIHKELLAWLLPLIDPVEIDFPIAPQSR
ncbi:MAG TPA: Dabb family protein [Terracidiphilus sp.]